MTQCRTNAGFTLVELSIVLVIIGLIIGGVLAGQQVMSNARITNTVQSVQAYQAQFQTYAQNYSFIPGDDPNAVARFTNPDGSSMVPGAGDGKGTLNANQGFDSTTATDETRLAWADLRAAGLVKSQSANGDTTVQPTNAYNGIYGFQNGAFNGVFTTTVLCLNNVTSNDAQAIDARLDDGNSKTGNIQAMASTGVVGEAIAGTVADHYGTAQTYTMCMHM